MTKHRSTWRTWLCVGFTLCLLLVPASIGYAQQDEPVHPPIIDTTVAHFVPGEVLVGLREQEVSAAAVFADLGIQGAASLDLRGFDGTDGAGGVTGYVLRVPAGQEQAMIATLQANPAVAFAEPNYLVWAANVDRPTDVAASAGLATPETAFLVNDPNYVEKQWYLPRINASRAWGLVYSADGFRGNLATIQIAIVDSGIDLTHPDLKGLLLTGKNYLDSSKPPQDDYFHGTHVAGLAGALTNNNTGVAGIAPQIKLDPRKVLDSTGSGTITNVSQGIRDAADAGANIINMSLQTYSRSPTMEAAVNYAASKGVLLIGAAGNNHFNNQVAYPAAFDAVMAIAATTYSDERAAYSNYDNDATEIELAAPGGDTANSMYNTWAKGTRCPSLGSLPLPQSGYCSTYGTSMAAGVVAGAAALLWSLDPDLSANEVRQLLRDTAAEIAPSEFEVGSGRLDLHAAVRRLLRSDLAVTPATVAYDSNLHSPPLTVDVRLDNPSGVGLDWQAALIGTPGWVSIPGSKSGSARYGQPGHFSLVISPTQTSPSVDEAIIQVVGNRPDTTQVIRQVLIDLFVGSKSPQAYLPVIGHEGGTIPPARYTWENPIQPSDRLTLTLTDESSVVVGLPFTFTLQGGSYATARVNADGFISFPDTFFSASLPNQCLPNQSAPAQAVYGWWANLDPGAIGARVSVFQPASDRYVIEFENVPTAMGVTPAYLVSFQIVLYRNGDVGLNYAQTPPVTSLPVTIGVEARDGLFYNQIVCQTSTTELGFPPRANRSFVIKANEVY